MKKNNIESEAKNIIKQQKNKDKKRLGLMLMIPSSIILGIIFLIIIGYAIYKFLFPLDKTSLLAIILIIAMITGLVGAGIYFTATNDDNENEDDSFNRYY